MFAWLTLKPSTVVTAARAIQKTTKAPKRPVGTADVQPAPIKR
jgi:hypothetical protein